MGHQKFSLSLNNFDTLYIYTHPEKVKFTDIIEITSILKKLQSSVIPKKCIKMSIYKHYDYKKKWDKDVS